MEKIGFKIDDCRTYIINEILERVSKPVNVERDKEYSQIGIRSFGKGLFYKESVTGEELGNKSVFWIEPDCFILNIVFAWEQAIGKTTQKELGMIASHRFPMYRPNLSKVDLDYLIYFFLTKTGKEILELSSPGGAGRNKTLGQDIFLNSSITLPPLSVQKLNGLILAKIDSLIQAKTQKLESLKSVKKSLLQKCFPKDGEKVPEIRFEGFSGEWIEINVYELVEERKEQQPQNDKYPLMAFVANQGIVEKGEKYDRGALIKDAVNKLYKITEYGDFIYSSNNLESGSIGMNKYGNACISPVYSIFKMINNSDSNFINMCLTQESFIKEMVKWRQGVVYGQWRIHEDDFLKIRVRVPKLEEQQKIGQFFSKYDSLISLRQKEIDNLKTIKKSLLQKMFV